MSNVTHVVPGLLPQQALRPSLDLQRAFASNLRAAAAGSPLTCRTCLLRLAALPALLVTILGRRLCGFGPSLLPGNLPLSALPRQCLHRGWVWVGSGGAPPAVAPGPPPPSPGALLVDWASGRSLPPPCTAAPSLWSRWEAAPCAAHLWRESLVCPLRHNILKKKTSTSFPPPSVHDPAGSVPVRRGGSGPAWWARRAAAPARRPGAGAAGVGRRE